MSLDTGLTDVPGVRVGHYSRTGRGWATGTTVVLLPPATVGGVDVRGGGPGTRETDVLSPTATVAEVHALCLTGGSAYGLEAATGVMAYLAERNVGFRVGEAAGSVVPIVPAAVIFDLGRGGSFGNRPDAGFGYRAAVAARAKLETQGAVGAGVGARAQGLQGGTGTAALTIEIESGKPVVVAALAVVNSSGSVIDPATALPWVPGRQRLRRPSSNERRALAAYLATATPALNTTIGVVATTAALSKPECTRMATVAHDGLARAVRPVHSMLDGDTIFAMATGRDALSPTTDRARNAQMNRILAAAADCFAMACTNAITFAHGTARALAYRDLCPSAFPVADV